MIVAQQIQAVAGIHDERAQSAAAAVRNAVAGEVVIVVIAARDAELNHRWRLRLMSGGIAGDSGGIQQHCGRRLGGRSARRGYHVSCARGRNRGRSRISDRAGGEDLAVALAIDRAERAQRAVRFLRCL